MTELPALPIWTFANVVYARPRAGAALMQLQDRYGYRITELLWAIWAAREGRVMTVPRVHALVRACRQLSLLGVERVREVRRFLRRPAPQGGDDSAAWQAVARQALELELALERLILERLAALTVAQIEPDPTLSRDDRSMAAFAHLTALGPTLEKPRLLADDRSAGPAATLYAQVVAEAFAENDA